MSDIQRYTPINSVAMGFSDDGDWIKHADHIAALEAVKATDPCTFPDCNCFDTNMCGEGGKGQFPSAALEAVKARAEEAVVAANALQVRLNVAEAALREQVDACDADDCEMCHRHRIILRYGPPSISALEAKTAEVVGYGVWINGKLSACAKSYRDSFSLYTTPPALEANQQVIETLRAALERIAKFDDFEPAGPAARTARKALDEMEKVNVS